MIRKYKKYKYNFISGNTFFYIIQDCVQRKRQYFPSPPLFPFQPLLFHVCLIKAVTLFLPAFSSLVCLLSLVQSKHLVICHSKIHTTCEECRLLSWRKLVGETEITVTIANCVCVPWYTQVVSGAKRWSIRVIAADAILFLPSLKRQFSWFQSTRVDHAEQERLAASYPVTLPCWAHNT